MPVLRRSAALGTRAGSAPVCPMEPGPAAAWAPVQGAGHGRGRAPCLGAGASLTMVGTGRGTRRKPRRAPLPAAARARPQAGDDPRPGPGSAGLRGAEQERGRAAFRGGGESQPSGPACPEGRGVGAAPPRRGCGRRRRRWRPPAAPPPPELQPVRAGRGPPAAPRCGAAPAPRGRLRAPAPRAARPQVTGPRGARGGGRFGSVPLYGGSRPGAGAGGGRSSSGARDGSARSPGRAFGKRSRSGSCCRPGASASLAVPMDDPPSALAVVPPGAPCWHPAGTGRCATSAPAAGTWQRAPVAINACPLRESTSLRVCPLRVPLAPRRLRVPRGWVLLLGRVWHGHGEGDLQSPPGHCADERFKPARRWKASMCNVGLWAGPRGRGERRGEPGAIRGHPSPRRAWPRGTGGLSEQMPKGTLAGCDA